MPLGKEKFSDSLIPRTGQQPRLIVGPREGQRSLYQQHVLDEDTYTEALSHIISRDFFPGLPHLHATNDYLSALSNNDPELLSASIRRLAALSHEKEHGRRSMDDLDLERARRAELAMAGTPYIAMPGTRGRALRTPVGARGWDTPLGQSSVRGRRGDASELDDEFTAGPSRPAKRRRAGLTVRDDLSLDAFQRNYTSEDNASFVKIVDEENKRKREEQWGWAWEAERKATAKRIEGEQSRKMILEAAAGGRWRVNGEGKRLIGGLAEGGRERLEGEAWREAKRIGLEESQVSERETALLEDAELKADPGALVPHPSSSSSSSLVKADGSHGPGPTSLEMALPPKHPLSEALSSAGLPGTALISEKDGKIVPCHETASGADDGRGRGDADKASREKMERDVMGDDKSQSLSLGGSGADMWGFKARNNLLYPPDADSNPFAQARRPVMPVAEAPSISHANTRLPEEEAEPGLRGRIGSTRGSNHQEPEMPTINNYPLLPNDPSPSPQDLPSILTWGSLLSTPRALDSGGDPLDSTPSYRLPEASRRDEIGRKLGDKASRSMKERARGFTPKAGVTGALSTNLRAAAEKSGRSSLSVRGSGKMAPPATPRRQADSLTPAARSLLERTVGRTPGWTGGGASSATGGSRKGTGWTPSPRVQRK
ncbi:hypothetical protein IAT38_008297 [Cryptococcus sp. DSM 104549]